MSKQNERDHGALRDEWIDQRLRDEHQYSSGLAAKKGVPHGTLRNHLGDWQALLDQRAHAVAEHVRERPNINRVAIRTAILLVPRRSDACPQQGPESDI